MYDVSGSNPAQTQLVFRDPHSESIETVGSEQVEEEVCVETERVPMVQQVRVSSGHYISAMC